LLDAVSADDFRADRWRRLLLLLAMALVALAARAGFFLPHEAPGFGSFDRGIVRAIRCLDGARLGHGSLR
jgi:hypothetical protein